MAERINLAQFDIDTRLIEDKIASNRQKIDVLKQSIKDTQNSIKDYQKQISDTSKEIQRQNDIQDQANAGLADGSLAQEDYNRIIQQSSQAIRDQEINLANLIQEERRQQVELNEMQNSVRSLTTENRRLNQALTAGATTLSENHGEYEQLKTDLAEARRVAYDLGAEMMRLERAGETNSERYNQVRREWQQASEDARELHDQILELETSTNDYRRNVGNYSNGIREAFSDIGTGFAQLLSGNVVEGMQTIRNSFSGLKDAAKELWTAIMANPLLALGVALAAVTAGVVQGMKAVFEYNLEINKLNKEVEQLTNLTGPVVDRLREYATALEEVFGKDFQDGVKEMNSLMKDFGLTSKEAYEQYQEGLAKGGAMNSEFGDSIREYGVLFAQNGYSAEEFLNLLNAGVDLDIYSDKLPDAIKEAGLSLNEQTKATRDALVNAFGESFSDDLLKRIRNGSTTVKQAVDEISQQAQKVGLNTQQIAQLNADVFKGAGEDAGGLLKIMEAVNLANNKEAQELTESQKKVLELADATVELEKAKTEAFKSDDIINFSKGFDVAWTKVKTVFVQLIGGIVDIVLWFDKLTGSSKTVNSIMDEITVYGKALFDSLKAVKGVFSDLSDAIGVNTNKSGSWVKAIGQAMNPLNILKGIIVIITAAIRTFSNVVESSRVAITSFAIAAKSIFGQVVEAAKLFINLDFSGALEKLKNISISKELGKAREEAERIVALNKQTKKEEEEKPKKEADKIKNNDKDTGASADAAAKAEQERRKLLEKQLKEQEKNKKAAEKDQADAAKQDLANAKERANIAIQATQAELAEYIAMNAEKLKSDKRLTQERMNEINKYLDDVREKQLKANEEERKSKIESLDEQIKAIKGNNAQELEQKKNLEAQKNVVMKEYDTKEMNIVNEVYAKRKEFDDKYIAQKREDQNLARALEYQKQISDLEKHGATEFEMQKVQLDQQTEQRLTSFLDENQLKRQLDQENYDINAEIEAQRRELENQIAIEQDAIKKQNLQNLLTALNIIQQDYANKEVQIAKAKEYAKLNAFANVAGAMAQILGKQTVLAKTAAIAEATINTYVGASKAFAQGGWWGIIQGAAIIAAGLANVGSIVGIDTGGISAGFSSIASTAGSMANKKAAKGMVAKGPSHSKGGIKAITPDGMVEIEGGEAVINKKSTAMFYDILSEINQLGGGVKFADGGIPSGMSVSKLPTIQNNIKQSPTITLDQNAINEIAMAVFQGTQSGFIGLSDNRQIQNGANF